MNNYMQINEEYLKMFQNSVINQNGQEQKKQQSNQKQVVVKTDADMKFSAELAAEFSNTVNEFTNICAKIVEKRAVDKQTSDKFYDLYSKIKNLADAASKTI